jgi:hypothetical protein
MDGVRLIVPPGAVPAGTVITIATVSEPAPDGYDALSAVFAFSPDGLVFAEPATIEMNVTTADSDVVVLWSITGGSGFEELPTTIAASGRYSAPVAHFSRGLLGRRHQAQSNDSGATDSGIDSGGVDGGTDGGGMDGGTCAPYGGTCSGGTVNYMPCCNNVPCAHIIDDAGSRYACLFSA